MSDPKKHHFLPQFYLRNFAISPQTSKYPHIWACKKAADPKPINVAIKDTACITDYHTLDPDKAVPDRASLEKSLSTIESKQSQTIDRILHERRVHDDDKPVLSAMLAIMRTRVPSFKRFIQESLRLMLVSTMDVLEENGRLPEPPDSVKPYLKGRLSDNLNIEISNWMLLRHMFDAAIHSRLAQILSRTNLLLVEAAESADFLTSDSPVSIYQPSQTTPSGLFRPLFDPTTEYWLPISSRIGILYRSETGGPLLKASEEETAELNRRQIISSAEYVYSSANKGKGVMMIPRYFSQSSGFSVQKIESGGGTQIVSVFKTISKP
jgi:hypothetical protein